MNASVQSVCPAPLISKPVVPVMIVPQSKPERRKAVRTWLSAGWLSFVGRPAAQPPHIVHVHVDSFYSAVEQALNPRLRGKAVVVVGGGAVASASPEAQSRGVVTGMKIPEFRKLCPNSILVPAEWSRYAEFAGRVRRILEAYPAGVEMTAFGSFYLDFSRLARSGKDFEAMLCRMQSEILGQTGLYSSVGAGTSRLVAVLAARRHRPCGFCIVRPGTESQFLSPFALETLRGIPSTYLAAVSQSGIATIGQLQRIPKPVLTAAFGAAMGNRIWQSARGCDARADWPSSIAQSEGIGKSPLPA
jgi:DNA polymerase IV